MNSELCGACAAKELSDNPIIKDLFECKMCGCFNRLPRHKFTDIPYTISKCSLSKEAAEIDSLHYINVLLDMEIYRKIENGLLWDVGCYIGGLVWQANKRGWRAHGNDIQKEHIEYGRDVYNVNIFEGHFEELPIVKNCYDVVIFHHGIEHIIDPIKAIQKAISILRDDGIIYLSHPCIPSKELLHQYADTSTSVGGHLYEWTYESFKFFVSLFEILEVEKCYVGSRDGKSIIPSTQTWVLRKKASDYNNI